jgi:predicted transcriptional regulator
MSQSLVEHAKELTLALIATGNVAPKDMQEMLQKTYASLSALKAQEEKAALPPLPASETALVDWRKSITKHAVTCLECGQAFKQLSLRHLGTHGLDNRSYRTKYGIPRTQPLSARAS